MDITKYRKWYLSENWGENSFSIVKYIPPIGQMEMRSGDFFRFHHLGGSLSSNIWNHPMVNSGNAFWINDSELCVGFELRENSNIFRPIFSHKRQRFLDKVNLDIISPIKFWNKVKSKYFYSLCNIKKIPIGCVKHIVIYIIR